MADQDQLQIMRHSMAHVMATAIKQKWPKAKFGVGPAVENGFYYDVDLGDDSLSEEDLADLESEMKKIIKADQPFEKSELSIDEALSWAKDSGQPYKEELLNDLKRAGTTVAKDLDADELGTITDGDSKVEKVSFYKNGPFIDLCRGPHVESTGKVGAFKLMRVSGAYWRGKDTNPQMQRIYGVAFQTEKELRQHLAMLEEAKRRDHRVLGEKLGLFFISDVVGSGLPLMMPKGEIIKRTLMDYMREKEESRGYQYVSTPVLTQRKLYELSGHAEYFLDDMYATEIDDEGNQFFLKPMNCPHHHMIYNKMVKSYRDLPLRLSEHAGLYRYELSGTLTGLIRMRGPITQNDSHTYVTNDQLKQEFKDVLELFREVYLETGIEDYWFRLSLPDFDKDKFVDDPKKWEFAAKIIREVLEESGLPYVEGVGEAAFYGPKVDIQTKNVIGKEDTIATVQLDILVPERMDLTFVDSNGDDQYPYIIHKSIMGAFERFMAFLLEKTEGNLPVWLAPEQIRIATVNQEVATVKCAEDILQKAKDLGLRARLDNNSESVGKKIRESEIMKVPYTLVIGEKEIESGQVTPRVRKDMSVQSGEQAVGVEQFLKTVAHEAKTRVNHTSTHG